ncbi:MAG: hypothetical protein L3J32_09155 [Rhizobiaceae bacterium]|nr:hypothetical protein [Rhizobiaceae bacterium]
MINKRIAVFVLATMIAGPSLAGERGSGFYAADCKNPGGGYAITINKDGTAQVDSDPNSYKNVLTSYSFFGNDTPSDFVIAILFDEKNSPFHPIKGNRAGLKFGTMEIVFMRWKTVAPAKNLNFVPLIDQFPGSKILLV